MELLLFLVCLMLHGDLCLHSEMEYFNLAICNNAAETDVDEDPKIPSSKSIHNKLRPRRDKNETDSEARQTRQYQQNQTICQLLSIRGAST